MAACSAGGDSVSAGRSLASRWSTIDPSQASSASTPCNTPSTEHQVTGCILTGMAQILPFRALRFTTAAGDLGRLLAPAHNQIASQERDQFAGEPNNLVHATRPPAERDDRSKFVRYARASATLAGWRRERVLAADGESA
ncbi:MAG: hypothetical protein C4320_04650, partial [Armatimonadota bacterium]